MTMYSGKDYLVLIPTISVSLVGINHVLTTIATLIAIGYGVSRWYYLHKHRGRRDV